MHPPTHPPTHAPTHPCTTLLQPPTHPTRPTHHPGKRSLTAVEMRAAGINPRYKRPYVKGPYARGPAKLAHSATAAANKAAASRVAESTAVDGNKAKVAELTKKLAEKTFELAAVVASKDLAISNALLQGNAEALRNLRESGERSNIMYRAGLRDGAALAKGDMPADIASPNFGSPQ